MAAGDLEAAFRAFEKAFIGRTRGATSGMDLARPGGAAVGHHRHGAAARRHRRLDARTCRAGWPGDQYGRPVNWIVSKKHQVTPQAPTAQAAALALRETTWV